MSHVDRIKGCDIRDLDALAVAAQELGGELRRDQRTYAWWGHSVGNYPLPAGFTAADLGKCDHALRFVDASYEVGVVARRDGKPGWELLWDFYPTGGLVLKLGAGGAKLSIAYQQQVAIKAARKQGFEARRVVGANGKQQLVLTKIGG